MPTKISLIGFRFSRLLVIKEQGKANSRPAWLCQCDCGSTIVVRGSSLRTGHTKSCGCHRRTCREELRTSAAEPPTRPDCRWIFLGQSLFSLVDEDDFEYINQYTWYASYSHKSVYAKRGVTKDNPWRSIQALLLKPPSDLTIDHINGDGLDNRRSNIRLCTNAENNRNKGPKGPNKTSQYKGVRKTTLGRWSAQIGIDRKVIHLGTFEDEAAAARAYNSAALLHHGVYAKLNLGI